MDRAVAVFEPLLEFAHVRGTNNEWADALSRLAQPGSGAVVPGPIEVGASEGGAGEGQCLVENVEWT